MLDFVRCDAAQDWNGPTPTLPLALALALTLTRCYATQDLNGIAAALAQMGFTKEGVDTRAFAVDLKEVPRPGDPHPHPPPQTDPNREPTAPRPGHGLAGPGP